MGKAAEALCELLKHVAMSGWAPTARLTLLLVVSAACVIGVTRLSA